MRILLVEDENSMVQVLQTVLTAQNYVVDVAQDGLSGWELVESFAYDLVLLDVMMPKLDGISFCRRLREKGNSVLVMLLTARDTTTDKLIGLDAGADDYMVKPFDIQELSARIRALLRRSHTTTTTVLTCGELCLDANACEITYADQPLPLSRKEYLLLELFLRNPTRVFSRSAILDRVWSFSEDPPDEDTIKSHIKSIRRKLNAVGVGNLIETLYGQGYRINPIHLTKSSSTKDSSPSPEQSIQSAVANIWAKTKGASLDRVLLLEQAIARLQAGTLDSDIRQQAIGAAHKLVGSLGTFGLEAGSHWAQQIEWLLQSEAITGNRVPPPSVIEQATRWITALRQVVNGDSDHPLPLEQNSPESSNPGSSSRLPHWLILEANQELGAKLAAEVVLWQYEATVVADLPAAWQCLQEYAVDLVILDPWAIASAPEYSEFCHHLTQRTPPIAIAIYSDQDSSQHRLEAVTLGCQLFIAKPASPTQVLQAVTPLLQTTTQPQPTILAVDDDDDILAALTTICQPHHVHLVGLKEPTQVWETLRQIQPDLLVLDIAMPGVSGLALCRSVRQDAQWNWLPIVFFTAQTDPEIVHQAYLAGADDYLSKSSPAEEIIYRIQHRLNRSAALRHQIDVDLATGLLNRKRATSALEQLLHLAARSQQVVSLTVLALDPLPPLPPEQEAVYMDYLLKQFGQFLQQQFRRTDVVARWGRTDFVVGMYGIRRDDGVERMAEVLEAWRSERGDRLSLGPLEGEQTSLVAATISFSAGVAEFPGDGMALTLLYRSAKAALDQAIEAGRDRILPAGGGPATSQGSPSLDALLVSADQSFIATIAQALETRGYSIDWVQSGQTALEQLSEHVPALRTKVVLIHDPLPDLSSLELLQQLGAKLLKQTYVIPVLQSRELAQQAQALGAFDYLLQPCSPSVVMNCLTQALRTFS